MLGLSRQTPEVKKPSSTKIKPGGKLPYTGQPKIKSQTRTALKTKHTTQNKPDIASRAVQGSTKTAIQYKKFLNLHEKAQRKVNEIEKFRAHLKSQLDDIDIALDNRMDKDQKKYMSELIDSLCNAQRDLRTVLVNNLRASYKAISWIDNTTENTTPEQQKVLDLVRLSLSDVHDAVDNMLNMHIYSFGTRDLNRLVDATKKLEVQINSPEFKQLSSTLLTNDQAHIAFDKQINSCNEMINVFNQAVAVLTKTAPTKNRDTIVEISNQGFDDYIKDAILTLKNKSTDSAKFRGTVSILATIVGVAILATTIVLALTIRSRGTSSIVFIILGFIFGGSSFTGGIVGGVTSLNMLTGSDAAMKPAIQLKRALDVLQRLSHPKAD